MNSEAKNAVSSNIAATMEQSYGKISISNMFGDSGIAYVLSMIKNGEADKVYCILHDANKVYGLDKVGRDLLRQAESVMRRR